MWLRRALDVRDGGCVIPGCDRPPGWCEAHHVTHRGNGGSTSLQNLALLCSRHHHELHLGMWTITVQEDTPRATHQNAKHPPAQAPRACATPPARPTGRCRSGLPREVDGLPPRAKNGNLRLWAIWCNCDQAPPRLRRTIRRWRGLLGHTADAQLAGARAALGPFPDHGRHARRGVRPPTGQGCGGRANRRRCDGDPRGP
ncbi:MAG: HNH endonuclease signature motif containing protein [Candidatus Nanopelagicales bacterium]